MDTASQASGKDASLASYAKYLADRFGTVTWIGGTPWNVFGSKLTPIAMPHVRKGVDVGSVKAALAKTKAAVAVYTDCWDTEPCQWWWLCCDDPNYDVSRIAKKSRRKGIRRGLDRCEIRLIGGQLLAERGYRVYRAAQENYGPGVKTISAESFAQDVLRKAEYPGRESWGAFVDGELVAYVSCIVVDDAVCLASQKSDPAYHDARPNKALLHSLTRHYLTERRVGYVTGGERLLLHAGSFERLISNLGYQDLMENLGYRRVYCPVRTVVHPAISALVKTGVTSWGKYLGLAKAFPGPMAKAGTVANLMKIARDCRHIAPNTSSAPA